MKKTLAVLVVLFACLALFANGASESSSAETNAVKEIVIWRPQNTATIEA